ncbi:hypothetical protein B0H19DRAFT_1274306 [Mycena capillaripes]|nr:hypothetical protein B0H19DRAFT_1274306 [Mycena capillaripes]
MPPILVFFNGLGGQRLIAAMTEGISPPRLATALGVVLPLIPLAPRTVVGSSTLLSACARAAEADTDERHYMPRDGQLAWTASTASVSAPPTRTTSIAHCRASPLPTWMCEVICVVHFGAKGILENVGLIQLETPFSRSVLASMCTIHPEGRPLAFHLGIELVNPAQSHALSVGTLTNLRGTAAGGKTKTDTCRHRDRVRNQGASILCRVRYLWAVALGICATPARIYTHTHAGRLRACAVQMINSPPAWSLKLGTCADRLCYETMRPPPPLACCG